MTTITGDDDVVYSRKKANLLSIKLGEKGQTEWVPIPITAVELTSLNTDGPRYYSAPVGSENINKDEGSSSSSPTPTPTPTPSPTTQSAGYKFDESLVGKVVVFCPVIHPKAAAFGDTFLWPGLAENSMRLKGRPYSGKLIEDGIGGMIDINHLDNFYNSIDEKERAIIAEYFLKNDKLINKYNEQTELNKSLAAETISIDETGKKCPPPKKLKNPYMGPVYDKKEIATASCNVELQTLSDVDGFLVSQYDPDEGGSSSNSKSENESKESAQEEEEDDDPLSKVDPSRIGIDAQGNKFIVPLPSKKEMREIERYKKRQQVENKEIECLLQDKPDTEKYEQEMHNVKNNATADLIESFFVERTGAICPIGLYQKEVALRSICVLTKDMFRMDKRKDARRALGEQWQASTFNPHIPINKLWFYESGLSSWSHSSLLQTISPLAGAQWTNKVESAREELNNPDTRKNAQSLDMAWLGGVDRVFFIIPESEF